MLRFLWVGAILLFGQDVDLRRQYQKLGSSIEWISDKYAFADGESIGRGAQQQPVDRDALFKKAQDQAAKTHRLILWHVIRVPGRHMNRAYILDRYMQATLFSDPDVVEMINSNFVPLRMVLDHHLDIQKFEFIEPGFVFMTADGKVVHRVDRIRTFSSAWMLHLLRSVLAHFGNDKLPEPKNAHQRRLARQVDPNAQGLERAYLLLHQRDLKGAEEALAKESGTEAEYLRSVVEFYTAREKQAIERWKKLAKEDNLWGWKAAANLVTEQDTLPMGPLVHSFEDFSWAPEAAYVDLPKDTRWPREAKDLKDGALRAVHFLLRNQRSDGGFKDSRYVYCDSPKILPNVFTAVTALAACALFEWRPLDPERIDPAIAKAEAYIFDESHINRGQNEEMYAQAYRLMYLCKKSPKAVDKMNPIVKRLGALQDSEGLWAHEYPNAFCTAAVLQVLCQAKACGAEGTDNLIKRATAALKASRLKNGRQPYDVEHNAAGAKDSMARSAVCEGALLMAGQSTAENVEAALKEYWDNLNRLQAIRVCDFHADGELGGFFYWHGVYHTSEAAMRLGSAGEHHQKFRDQVLSIAEIDGSFIDSHELGKCYGTSMALLVLRNCVRSEDEH
jgi:hypothetical protein